MTLDEALKQRGARGILGIRLLLTLDRKLALLRTLLIHFFIRETTLSLG
jgi:hypothetical protein